MDESDFDKSLRSAEELRKKRFKKLLGQRFRAAREAKALRQDTVSINANLAVGTLAKIEAGSVSPEAYTLYKLAKVLKIPLSTLLDFKV
jgi:transcriptional regulator with XRE-family HTH domain